MSEVCIYTHNVKLFYKLSLKFKEEKLKFSVPDKFEDIHPAAKVLLTTQKDLDDYKPDLPIDIDVIIIMAQQSMNEIFFITHQHLNSIYHLQTVTIAIDPGARVSGVAVFMNDIFIFSRQIRSMKKLSEFIHQIIHIYPNPTKNIKIGNGYSRLTKKFIRSLLVNKISRKKVQYSLVNEFRTNKKIGGNVMEFDSIHEQAAIMIGLRQGQPLFE